MHRPMPSLRQVASSGVGTAGASKPSWGGQSVAAVLAFLTQSGLFAAAWRENRKRDRVAKRSRKGASYPYCGARQRARYSRQVAEGRLKVENGLIV